MDQRVDKLTQIYVVHNGEQLGPYNPDEVAARLAQRQIAPSDKAWYEGLTDWVPLVALWQLLPRPSRRPPPAPGSASEPHRLPPMSIPIAGVPPPIQAEKSWRDVASENLQKATEVRRRFEESSQVRLPITRPRRRGSSLAFRLALASCAAMGAVIAVLGMNAMGVPWAQEEHVSAINPILQFPDAVMAVTPPRSEFYTRLGVQSLRNRLPLSRDGLKLSSVTVTPDRIIEFNFVLEDLATTGRRAGIRVQQMAPDAARLICNIAPAARPVLTRHDLAYVFAARDGQVISTVHPEKVDCGSI